MNLNLSWIGLGIVKIGILTLIKLIFIFIFIFILIYLLYIEHFEDPGINVLSNNIETNNFKAGFLREIKKVGGSAVLLLGTVSSVMTIDNYIKDEILKNREKKIIEGEKEIVNRMATLNKEFYALDSKEQISNKYIYEKSNTANDIILNGFRTSKEINDKEIEIVEINKKLENLNLSVYDRELLTRKLEQMKFALLEKKKGLSSIADEVDKIKVDWEKQLTPSQSANNNNDESLSPTAGSSARSSSPQRHRSEGEVDDSGKSKGGGSGGSILSPDEDIIRIPIHLIQNLFICIFFLNSIVFSCIISIIFIYFGDYLIEKYSLDKRWPRFAKFLALRRKFQSYYLKLNIILILILVSFQIGLSIYIIMI